MQGRSQGRQQYSVACSCGAAFTLDARGFGKPRPGPQCGATVTVAWGRDPKTHKAVPVAMTQKKAAPQAPSGPSGAPSAARDTAKAICTCGNSRRVPASKQNSPPRCVQCGRLMRIEEAPLDRPKSRVRNIERPKPSAPLLPLHLRAPRRIRIKPGAQSFDCVCGQRVMIRAGSEGLPIQCLACDRFHLLEVEGAEPPRLQAGSRAKPPGVLSMPSRPLLLGEFLCKCGEIQPPRTSRTGKSFECGKCGRKGTVEVEKDADGKLTMRPTLTYEPKPGAPPAAKPMAPSAGKPADTPRQEEGVVAFEELAPSSVAPAPVVDAPVFETAAGSQDEPDEPPTVASDAQIVVCECGAEILLSMKDVGSTVQCPACADVMIVEQTPDPKTRQPVLSVRPVGGLDDPDWKLEGFV